MNKPLYKVMITMWSTCFDDYYDEEYSGTYHDNYEEAQKELAEASAIFKERGEDAWIEEV